jgi:hypothetical protein
MAGWPQWSCRAGSAPISAPEPRSVWGRPAAGASRSEQRAHARARVRGASWAGEPFHCCSGQSSDPPSLHDEARELSRHGSRRLRYLGKGRTWPLSGGPVGDLMALVWLVPWREETGRRRGAPCPCWSEANTVGNAMTE